MPNIVPQAQALLTLLLGLMASRYQRDSLQALLGLFLEAQGRPLPSVDFSIITRGRLAK
ncbi:MAG: hypothetical protein OHK0012_06340 [Synechococcales cyanobacterium]